MANKRGADGKPIVVKKYPNRRLYDTGQSTYVTLEDLRDMIQENVNFVVHDAKTGKDITREVLTQVLADQEARGEGKGAGGLLPTGFLRKLIAFYGLPTQSMVSAYLEHTLDLFISNQERLQTQINKSFDGLRTVEGLLQNNPVLEELSRQNREIIDRALNVIDPFGTLPRAREKDGTKTG
jgi:polyhydroxyalkanoate synthesis repressor PhaR